MGARLGSLWGRLVADVDSVFGLTAPLGAPPVVLPASDVVWALTVSDVAPRLRKWLMTEPGMLTSAPRAVWKVPPASMLEGGGVVSNTTAGKLDVRKPGTTHVSDVTTPTSKVELVLACGPPSRLMVCPVKTLVREVPAASVSVTEAV